MQQADIERKIRQRPFRPFRMHLTDGVAYEARHPELIILSRRYLVLGLNPDPAKLTAERTVEIDLLHIVRTDYLDELPASSNGG